MNLSALAAPAAPASTPAGASGTATDGSRDSGGESFSRVLRDGTASDAGTPRNTEAAQGKATGRQAEAAHDDAGRTARDGRTRASGDAEAVEPGTATAQPGAPAAETAEPQAADPSAWPPPGLASLLAAAMPPPATAAIAQPGLTQSAAADGGHAHAATATTTLRGTFLARATAAAGGAAVEATPVAGDVPSVSPPGASSALADTGLLDATAEAPAPAPVFVLPAAAAASTPAAAPTLSAPHAPVPDLHGEAFADEVGTHVQWLAEQKIGHAHIRIAPEDLGPVEIRLRLDGDRISADFSSAQPEVRQALESGLSRLREMLGQNGFQLAHAGVGQQSGHAGGGQGQASGPADAAGDGTDAAAMPAPVRLVARGLLDAYA